MPDEKPISGDLSLTNRRYILLFCAAAFFFWAALYLYVPILPVYTQSLGASLSMVGAVVASYAIPQLLFRIPIGVLFDTISRRKLMLSGGILTTFIGALALGLAPNPWFLFLARAITGLAAANWVVFVIYFTAYYPQQNTQRPISIISFVQGIAIVAAAACGGAIAEAWGSAYTFWIAALLGIISLLALLATREPTIVKAEPFTWPRFKLVATFPPLLIVSFIGILCQFAVWASLFGFIPVYAVQIGASSADLGIISMLAQAASATAALMIVPIARRWGNSNTILLGSILMGGAILAVPQIHNVHLLELAMIVNGLGRGLIQTTLLVLCVQGIAPGQRATAMGFYQAVYAVGMFLGPMLSGYLADNLGLATVFYLSSFLSLIMIGMAYLPALVKNR